jgi:glycosyltransferase involved in cell wall biosynthesis
MPQGSATPPKIGLSEVSSADTRESGPDLGESRVLEVSVVMPCLNEADTVESCIRKARQALQDQGIAGEVIVADNGSSDGSPEIARKAGARVVHVEARGYGSALMGGIAAARGRFIIMGDADDSYDFTKLEPFLTKLREGYDLVMGNRFQGGIQPGAMPFLNRYLGNPVLSAVGRLFFRSPVRDFHCGLRAFSKEAAQRMDLRTTGMEFASEIIVKASLLGMRIAEVPTTLAPAGRRRPPHMRPWRDGWRHLRFLLVYSPQWLFLLPGALLMLIGLLISLWILPGPRTVGGITVDVHTLLYAAVMVLLGFQAISFAVFAKIFAITEGLFPADPRFTKLFRVVTLEVGLAVGGVLILLGLAGSWYAFSAWAERWFGPLNSGEVLRLIIPAVVSLTLGLQIVFSSFFLSVLGLRRR